MRTFIIALKIVATWLSWRHRSSLIHVYTTSNGVHHLRVSAYWEIPNAHGIANAYVITATIVLSYYFSGELQLKVCS